MLPLFQPLEDLIQQLFTQRMFSGLTEQPPINSGKKIYGLPSRRDAEFSIGWSNNNQLNEYQMRKSKNKEVTGKITTQAIIQGQDINYPQRQLQVYDPSPKDYQRIFYENPNLSQEELEKMMLRYDEYRGAPSRGSKMDERLSENSGIDRRAPIRPRESMKDIIYNGVGTGEQAYQKSGSRQQRNNGYNYYPTSKI